MSVSPIGDPRQRVFHPVRVVLQDGEVVLVKHCPQCGRDKCVSQDVRESEFPQNGRRPDGRVRGWKPICKTCYAENARVRRDLDRDAARARDRAAYARMKDDPERFAFLRDYWRTYRSQRSRDDPAFRELGDQRSRRWKQQKVKEDPDYFTPERRAARMAVRNGMEVVPPTAKTLPRVDAEPFRQYLVAVRLALGLSDNQALGRALGIEPKRVERVLRGQERVAADVVDRAIQNAPVIVLVGRREILRFDDLYREPLKEPR